MAPVEVESDPSIVEEDPRLTRHQMGPEIQGVGLRERDPQSFSVDDAQVGGVPVGRE
jgi:hypothetical protein